MKLTQLTAAVSLSAALLGTTLATTANAQRFDVEVTNLTSGIYFTPLLVAAHNDTVDLFEVGTEASPALISMAEGGDISGLSGLVSTNGTVEAATPAGLHAPGTAKNASLDTDGTNHDYLTITGMLLPTNDAFVGLDSWKIPETPGTYTIYINAYDAGSEANDELAASIPQPGPIGATLGANGTGVSMSTEDAVLIHRGNLGDTNSTGGASDLNSQVHRWLNPVARVTVTVMN